MPAAVLTGPGIELYRLHVMKQGLKLEGLGMKRRGRSMLSIVKSEFGWKGNREKIQAKLDAHIKEAESEYAE